MKIACLLPDLRGGGAERVNLDLAYALTQLGHQVEFVLMQARGELIDEARSAFSVIDLKAPRSRRLLQTLSRYLVRSRPDALLASMWPLTIIAPLAARLSKSRCQVAISEHSMLSLQYLSRGQLHRAAMRASMGIGYRMAHARIGVSSGVVDDIVALSGLSRSRFQVIHNPVPPRMLPTPEAIRAVDALWHTSNGKRLITVGSMKAEKNHLLLLKSFALMAAANAQLMFVGTGTGEAELRRTAAELGIEDRVIFAGFHRDPTPFYLTADLFVLSSIREGLPTVLIEALACGLPVVSTDCPSGPAEILENGRFGSLVPVNDAEALACAMTQALAQPHDREALKARARDFAPEKAAKAYLAALGFA